ncbi:MAG: putative GTPase of the OBG/HflX superfamily [archaeon GW2011_AR20]|nr:MAG: putative GTPase of the OBG/HflX superfamily [archaeon GW2011_AR20]MBS3160964.1 50S ribosome-binding GTPase [Candidatus Woesearchaeota archaeon]
MPINAGYEYGKAESEFNQAGTVQEKLLALRKMLSVAPKHKGAESLLKQIKEKIAKYKELAEKEKKAKKGSGKTLSIKKEGAATICIIGTVNSGKSTLLKKLTNANVLIAPYPFTTKKPEIGVLDYKGIKLQIVEIPAIAEKFEYSELGPSLLAIIRQSDLLIITFKEKSELKLIDKELYGIDINRVYYYNQENIKDLIWNNLNLIKVYTKQPGKRADYPPIALKKHSSVKDLAEYVHKDFLRKFDYARIFGNGVKFQGQRVGVNYNLKDEDVVELHLKD